MNFFIVSFIRLKYPSPDGKYVGFKPSKNVGGGRPAKKRK